jgi:type I restriction enzyme S subunit
MGKEAFNELQRSYTVEETDVVMAVVGGTTGKVARVPSLEKCTVQRSTAILRPDPQTLDKGFLYYWLQSDCVQSTIQGICQKYAAQPGIYLEDVSNLPLIVPPLDEQTNIAEHLDAKSDKLNRLQKKIQQSIDKLKEKRRTLITSAVTGQIDISDREKRMAIR